MRYVCPDGCCSSFRHGFYPPPPPDIINPTEIIISLSQAAGEQEDVVFGGFTKLIRPREAGVDLKIHFLHPCYFRGIGGVGGNPL